jgi:hypothetical protein
VAAITLSRREDLPDGPVRHFALRRATHRWTPSQPADRVTEFIKRGGCPRRNRYDRRIPPTHPASKNLHDVREGPPPRTDHIDYDPRRSVRPK